MVEEVAGDDGLCDRVLFWWVRMFGWGDVFVWGECHCGECTFYCKCEVLFCCLQFFLLLIL